MLVYIVFVVEIIEACKTFANSISFKLQGIYHVFMIKTVLNSFEIGMFETLLRLKL